MRIDELCSPLHVFIATVRVVNDRMSTSARTTVSADNLQQAHAMLSRLYGRANVISVQPASIREILQSEEASSPVDQQIKATQQRAKQVSQQARRISAQRSLQRAQQKLARAQRSVAAGGTHQG